MFHKFAIAAAVIVSATLGLHAQEIARPVQKRILPAGTTPYFIPGSFTTNIPAATAPIIPFSRNGLGMFFRAGATNAASTTNATFVFEQVFITDDGTVQVVDTTGSTITASVPQNGTTGYDYQTNIVSTLGNFPNSLIRIRSIQNTNLASIWISNAVYVVKE